MIIPDSKSTEESTKLEIIEIEPDNATATVLAMSSTYTEWQHIRNGLSPDHSTNETLYGYSVINSNFFVSSSYIKT